MKKRILATAIAFCMLLSLMPASALALEESSGNYVAQIGEEKYESLEAAIAAGGEITLLADIDLPTAINVTKAVTLHLNGKSLTVTNDTAGDGVFHVTTGGDLTINGNGTINGIGKNDYNMAIWADGGNVTINGGTYTNEGATASSDPAHMDLIYVKNGGTVTINGGIFLDETPAWTLNSHDTAKGTITVTGGTFKGFNPADCATEGAGTNFVAEGYKSNEASDGTWFVQAEYVADVNGVQYGTVAEAIAAANNGDTVTLLPVVIHEPIKPMAGDSQHKKEKDIIIHGFNSYTDPNGSDWGTYGETILTGGLYWGYDDGHTRSYSVEVSGITFQGKGLTVADEANVNISYNKFTDIVGDAIAVLDQEYDSMEGNVVITNNRIEGATGAGVNLRNPYCVTVQRNYIANTGFNSITIQKKSGNADNIGYVNIENNTLKDWAYNSTEGRALRASFTGDATEKSVCFRENKMIRDGDAPEEYVKITGLSEAYYVDLDNNYWNSKNPGEIGMVLADNVDFLNWYYEDADMQNSVQTYMASVGSSDGTTYYLTLKEAVDAAQDGEWVYLDRDASGSGIIIDKSISIDFRGYTYTLTEPPVGSTGTETLGFQMKAGNVVTLYNGRLTVDENYAKNYAILIQNYATLTLTDMNLDGTNLDRHKIKDYDYSYVLSNNSGDVRLDVSTYITANDDGDAYAFDVCKYSSYEAPTVTVDTTGRIIGKIEVTSGLEENLTIENGIFSANPSAYLPDNRIATLSNGLFYITDKPEDAPNVSVDISAADTSKESVKVDTQTDIDNTTNIDELQQSIADAVSQESTKQNLQDAATNLQNDTAVVGTKEEAEQAIQSAEGYDAEKEVEVQVKPYLEVKVEAYNASTKTVKLDIQALYNVVAVQKNDSGEVVAEAPLKSALPMDNVTTAITITIPLPAGFADDGETVYIRHTKDDGSLYIHKATVSVDSETGATTATFVNDKGFSSFEVLKDEVVLFDFYGANVDLGNTFNMNFYFAKNAVSDWTGHYAQIIRRYADGSTNSLRVDAADWVSNNDYWQITYAGINAKEMCDIITVQIFDAEGKAVSTVWQDSIQLYASRAFSNPDSQAKDFKMIIAMLDFGAVAQEFTAYNILNPANSAVTTQHRSKAEQ